MAGKAIKIVLMVIGGLCLAAGLALLLGLAVLALWNWLMPVIFGLPEITYWQAWGLLILGHLLLGGGHPKMHHDSSKKGGFREKMRASFHSCAKSDGPPETPGPALAEEGTG